MKLKKVVWSDWNLTNANKMAFGYVGKRRMFGIHQWWQESLITLSLDFPENRVKYFRFKTLGDCKKKANSLLKTFVESLVE